MGAVVLSAGELASPPKEPFSDEIPVLIRNPPSSIGRLDNPLRGIAFIVLSTFFMSTSDATSKYLSSSLPAIEIAWIRFFGFVLIMAPAIFTRRNLLKAKRPKLQLLRGFTLAMSSICFIFGLRFLPIAEATATSFVAPLFVTALSIPLLGESIGFRRWMAALIGLLGVLIVVRPGTSAFQPAAMLTILSALAWAFTLIFTRKMSGDDAALTTLAYSALVGFIGLSVVVPFVWISPSWQAMSFGVVVAVASTAGHWIVVLAYRYADASVLAPFTYSQLVFATLFGYSIFGDVPDRWTFVGASVIIASGLYTAHRERVRREQQVAYQ
jgi:drug/metabolite transporter (DMT)-like permease